jgi:general secretion pathway protein H
MMNVRSRAPGFTLIELMVVVALIAIASAVASLALRDPASTRLDHEGARLVALLEAARTEARAAGLSASWEPRSGEEGVEGFRFVGFPPSSDLPKRWLAEGVTAEVEGARAVQLGPEPLIPPQRIVLHLDEKSLTLTTDGLGPFSMDTETAPAAQP